MVQEDLSPSGEATLTEVLRQYETKGFTVRMTVRAGGIVRCHGCGQEEPAEQVPVEALHRFEGASDPEDMAALAAVECPACGEWGTLVLSYGPEGSAEDGEVLRRLMDDRDHSVLRPGL